MERFVQLRLRQIGNSRQQPVPELATDRRTGLRNVLSGRSEPIEPRHQRGVHVAGTDNTAGGTAESAPLACAPDSSTDLVSSSTNNGTPSVRSVISSTISAGSAEFPATFCDHHGRVAPVEPRQSERRHMRLPGPWWLKLGTEHGQQHHRPVADSLYCALQQFARTRVDPVKVIERYQHRLLPREALYLTQKCLEGLLLFALRRDIQRWREIG
jgi:hypothetical protein